VTREELIDSHRMQAGWCAKLGSPLYASLLERIAQDLEASGKLWIALEPYLAEPRRSLLHLRFLSALHRQALAGQHPELARCYPSCGGTADPEQAWKAIECGPLPEKIPPTVQTNEVGRSGALRPGFLEIARRTKLPLRLLEIGCSAGLNLRQPLPDPIVVKERRGCDLWPIEPDDQGRLTLLSYVWPDQTERFQELDRAIAMARDVPATLDQADAVDWTEQQLARPVAGVATVLFHSIMLMYLSDDSRARFEKILNAAGERATDEAPLAWLAMEPDASVPEAAVDLTFWPGGERVRIATAGFHGRNVSVV
jgi:hypothetical protein